MATQVESTPLHPEMIRDAVGRCQIRKVDLAARAGVHVNSLVGVEDDGWNPRWDTLEKLCTAAEEIKRERA